MAKYTMLLAEYLKMGGQLPASFALIQGFEDLFVAKYCDYEIGFETDELFRIKLECKANLVMQTYADKISTRVFYWTKINNPVKTYYEKIKTKTNIGAQQNTSTELPFDAQEAEPNAISDLGAREDTNQVETWRNDEGETIDELMRMLDYLNKEVTTIVEKCLNEFKTLFMGIY